jgi:hypothetical protein
MHTKTTVCVVSSIRRRHTHMVRLSPHGSVP